MTRTGLERQRWVEAIDDFVRLHGRATPRWAILLTYELTLDTLARSVLPVLSRRGRRFRCVVLADQARLEAALSVKTAQLPGAVNLHPIRCKHGGVFHPKLILLRAGRHVRACFGSANITDGGLGTNLEFWTATESAETLAGLQDFLGEIIRSSEIMIDDGARRSIRRALCGLSQEATPSVWTSFEGSFSRRLREGPERHAKRATIISPMYAGSGGIVAARKSIPTRSAQLYTTASVPVPSTAVAVYDPPHPASQAADSPEAFPPTLHAKAYVFHGGAGRGATLAWIGSANFTAQALTKSAAQGGNVELMVRATLPADEVDELEFDLKFLFKKQAGANAPDEFDKSVPPRPVATVLAGELIGSPGALRLVVHTTIRQGKVELEHEGRRIFVAIKSGRGVVDGEDLRRLLPDLDLSAAQVLVIGQRIGRKTVPIVVNVPHVPAEADGSGAEASIDALLDDLLGRVRVPGRPPDPDPDDEDAEGRDDDDPDGDEKEIERRLDEVRHQGELDRLAVKAAMLRKLAISSIAAGPERDGVMAEGLRALLAAGPPHLHPSLRALLGNPEPGETP